MNIFYLDNDARKCAEYHCDKHIVKMITESAQLLCSAYYYTGEESISPYKLTHKNHPCSVWVRESLSNWLWLRELATELYNEYKYRYDNKKHKAGEVILALKTPNLHDYGITKRPQALPLKYMEMDTMTAYRNYYRIDKAHLLKYTKRDRPYWL
jgi:hypothetical protein